MIIQKFTFEKFLKFQSLKSKSIDLAKLWESCNLRKLPKKTVLSPLL
uniref:Uncharacterized protein n=1 Tax=Siphoviridae sp. ctYh54 TaxID=2826379 RepID=A0A8S5MEW7_9CAUD|nr:MAG TPA: hypothetical protein [Siphoviridae sp. ctYh54]